MHEGGSLRFVSESPAQTAPALQASSRKTIVLSDCLKNARHSNQHERVCVRECQDLDATMLALEHVPGGARRRRLPAAPPDVGRTCRRPRSVPLDGRKRRLFSGRGGAALETLAETSHGKSGDERAHGAGVVAAGAGPRLGRSARSDLGRFGAAF